MGREAEANVQWRGETGLSRVLLESNEIILRGDLHGRIARAGLTLFAVEGDDLRIATPEGPLVLTLGAKTATSWAAVLAKPPPSLAQKLGIGPDALVYATGSIESTELAMALTGAITDTAKNATILVAVLATADDLHAALSLADVHPTLPIWCVYRKGTGIPVGDAQVRAAFRANGSIDTKSCAVSDCLTATRYGKRRA
jgi:hypothetical protein